MCTSVVVIGGLQWWSLAWHICALQWSHSQVELRGGVEHIEEGSWWDLLLGQSYLGKGVRHIIVTLEDVVQLKAFKVLL